MKEFLIETFTIRTGMPFGYILFLGIIFILFCYSILQFIKYAILSKRSKSHPLIAFVLFGFSALVVWVSIVSEGIEYNPTDITVSDICGRWRDGESELLFYANGKYQSFFKSHNYQKRLGIKQNYGYWYLNDYQIFMYADQKQKQTVNNPGRNHAEFWQPRFRVLKVNGRYRLILDDFVDLDLWDGRLAFKKLEKGEDQRSKGGAAEQGL
mgnify:CR=1 FL=1